MFHKAGNYMIQAFFFFSSLFIITKLQQALMVALIRTMACEVPEFIVLSSRQRSQMVPNEDTKGHGRSLRAGGLPISSHTAGSQLWIWGSQQTMAEGLTKGNWKREAFRPPTLNPDRCWMLGLLLDLRRTHGCKANIGKFSSSLHLPI